MNITVLTTSLLSWIMTLLMIPTLLENGTIDQSTVLVQYCRRTSQRRHAHRHLKHNHSQHRFIPEFSNHGLLNQVHGRRPIRRPILVLHATFPLINAAAGFSGQLYPDVCRLETRQHMQLRLNRLLLPRRKSSTGLADPHLSPSRSPAATASKRCL